MTDPYSNLPPGVTQTDIELYSGALRHCAQCGKVFEPTEDDQDLCPKCREETND